MGTGRIAIGLGILFGGFVALVAGGLLLVTPGGNGKTLEENGVILCFPSAP